MGRRDAPGSAWWAVASGARTAVFALVFVGVFVPAALSGQIAEPTRWEALARELLRELVNINTTQSGDITAAAEAMAARLRAAGFPASDVHVVGPSDKKKNLVARLRGRNAGLKPMLALAHLDVVEARAEDWTMDPFTFVEQDGYFYGRGTTDDKDEAAIYVANLIRLREEGFVPERDIIIALTADEEGGPENGVDWLLKNRRDLIDAAFALNEGGGGAMKGGKRVSNNVQASEKVYRSFQLEVTNRGGHSSLPVKDNAIYHLADALTRIWAYDFPVRLNEVTRAFFERTAALETPEIGAAMRAVLRNPDDQAAVAVLAELPHYNARLRTTCVATMLEGGHAQNALPQRARAVVNCRILPTDSPDSVHRTLERVVANSQVAIRPLNDAQPSPPSPLVPEVLQPIERITQEIWPGVPVIPTMSTGATDGLYLRNAGVPVYGVSGIFGDVDDVRAHGQDERILARSYFEGLEFLYRLLKALAGGPAT